VPQFVFLIIGNPKLPAYRRARQQQIDERLVELVAQDQAKPVSTIFANLAAYAIRTIFGGSLFAMTGAGSTPAVS
jgi:hypothetical protein